MSEYIYDVTLKTQLGMKNGIMRLCIERGKIYGYLDILQHSEPFDGKISLTGDCTLHGSFKTLMRSIEYIATGRIDRNNVQLLLQNGDERFVMTGTAMTQEEQQVI